ncbi:MAG: flagellar hook-length control protein FliK [Paucibacter sp.]|nr:flagellar hook-length control protein FliK [Roseateles sp.]
MTSPTSHLLNNASFTASARADGSAPAPMRPNKASAESPDSFAMLMKSYGAGQARPPSPDFVSKPSQVEAPSKPAAKPIAAPAASDAQTELQRQEKKLAQKKPGQADDGRTRAPTAGTAPKPGASAALKAEAPKMPAAQPGADADAASPARSAQAERKKQGESNDTAAGAQANAAVPNSQQTNTATAALGTAGAGTADAGKGLDMLRQGVAAEANLAAAAETAFGSAARASLLESGVGTDAEPMGAARQSLVNPTAAGQGRALLLQQQMAGLATQQAQATAANPTGELAPGAGSAFASELSAAQGSAALSQGGSNALIRPEGFAVEGMLSAAGLAPQTAGETQFDTGEVRQLTLSQPLTEASFAPEMAARLSVLAADGVQEARLHLNPAEMGPVSVQIIVEGQMAQVSFHAEHEQTRQILEQSLPDLAAALRDSGLTLSGGGVFQQPGEQNGSAQARPDGKAESGSGNRGTMRSITDPEPVPMLIRPSRGVVDLYA